MSVGSETRRVRAKSYALQTAATGSKPLRLSGIRGTVLLLEFVTVSLVAYLSSVFYHVTTMRSQPSASEYIPAAIYIGALLLLISIALRHFTAIQRQPLHLLLGNGLLAVAVSFSIFLSTLFLLKGSEEYSRGSFVLQILAVTIVVSFTRTLFFFWLQSAIRAGIVAARQVVLIGDDTSRLQFTDLVRTTAIRSVGLLPFPLHGSAAGTRSCDALVNLPAAQQTIEACRLAHADDIVILASPEQLPAAPELARLLSELPVCVHIVPSGSINFFGTSRIGELGDLKTLEVSRPPLSGFDRAIKRIFDTVVAGLGLLLLAPLFAIVAIAIKLESRGPVLYWQDRHGYNNTVISVAKFRSMFCDACQADHFVQAKRDDSRVTHVGRILRRTNIDELPQLINVLIGNMSIVGPRPHATAHNAMFEGRILPFSRRHNIKPGITGWAQVNGHRGETDTLEKMQRRVEHDLYYIDNWSFVLDLKIVLMTLFSKRVYINAY